RALRDGDEAVGAPGAEAHHRREEDAFDSFVKIGMQHEGHVAESLHRPCGVMQRHRVVRRVQNVEPVGTDLSGEPDLLPGESGTAAWKMAADEWEIGDAVCRQQLVLVHALAEDHVLVRAIDPGQRPDQVDDAVPRPGSLLWYGSGIDSDPHHSLP